MRGNTMEELERGPAVTGLRPADRDGISGARFLPEGELRFTQENRAAMESRESFEAAAQRGEILEAPCVLCDCQTMELTLELPDGMRGIIPRGEAVYTPDGEEPRDIAVITRVGRPVQFRVTGFRDTPRGRVALCSRREVQREARERWISALTPGDLIPARVTHLEPFGAFCDVGAGTVALLPVDRVSVSRVSHPADRFRVGERIRAAVLSLTEEGRIYLTHRELLGTWEENAAPFSAGQTVRGIVRSAEDYGVFVELTPNLAGLAEASAEALPGHRCSVYIKSILPERMKIKLVLIEVGEPAGVSPGRYAENMLARKHIDRWLYSPEGCGKVVETVFSP